jgi:hypothetical protein
MSISISVNINSKTMARSEKSLASTQQSLAAKESEAAALSQKTVELEQANAALVKRAHQNRKSGSAELQERLHDALSQLQQLRADFEDKQVRRSRPLRARSARLRPQRRSSATACCACAIFLWKSYPQLICSFKPSTRCMPRCCIILYCCIQHCVHAAALTAVLQAKVCIAELHSGIDLVLSGEAPCSRICARQVLTLCAGADPKVVFHDLQRQQSNGHI